MTSISLQRVALIGSFACFTYAAVNDREPSYNRTAAIGLALLVASMLAR